MKLTDQPISTHFRRKGPRLLLVITLCLSLISGTSSASALTSAPESKHGNKPLVTSQLYIADASYCENVYDYKLYPCPGARYQYLSAVWAVSVTNPNRSAEARNVRARVVLMDVSGNEVMNKVMQVAARLAPGQTAWLSPSGSNVRGYWQTDASEGQGAAVSGTVTVLPHPWARGSKLRTIQSPMEFAAVSGCSYSWDEGGCFKYNPTAAFPNPGAEYKAYLTAVLFGDDGAPIGGVRFNRGLLTSIKRGNNSAGFYFNIPGSLSKRIADIQLFVSR